MLFSNLKAIILALFNYLEAFGDHVHVLVTHKCDHRLSSRGVANNAISDP